MMAYRKFKADNIFNGDTMLPNNMVLVLQQNGVVDDIVDIYDAGDDIENVDGIICPGFINTHCHIELSHLKNKIKTHKGLVNFVQEVMQLRTAGDEEKHNAMLQAADELYISGTVAVGDICNSPDSIFLKENSNIYWHNFLEVSGFVPAGAQKRFDDIRLIVQQFKGVKTIVPHAPYSVSEQLFGLINDVTKNEIISIHNQESPHENELYKNGGGDFLRLYKNLGIDVSNFQPKGKNSLASYLPYFTNNQKIILVHNTFTNQADIVFAKNNIENESFFCLCPNANLFIENQLPPVELLMKAGVNITLGTDSYASNWQLNIYEEIKTIQKHFPEIELKEILKWATINGANALGIDDVYGSFSKGKKPGVVVINENRASRIY